MKTIRPSHVADGNTKYNVVDMEPGDTIPQTAIKIDGEWHIPETAVPTPESTEPTEKATERPHKRRGK